MTELYTFYRTCKHDGSWYHAGGHYQLDDQQRRAMSDFCAPFGDDPPGHDEPTQAELRRESRRRCADVEKARKAEEEIQRAIMSERRTTLRRIAALEIEVTEAVDEFEQQELRSDG